ncbi:MAG TPA: glutathione S-transferase [Crenalkalicoccus sp.]|nr:glutathione S-transferase [Crenalkalicoccus sp.]
MLKVWGRASSSNVMKVLWLCEELGLAYDRIDVGGPFGGTKEPAYLAMNPNCRVPTLEEDGFTLWESNSILRYLCNAHAPDSPLYPKAPRARADVERWMDWQLASLGPPMSVIFWTYVRTPEPQRDMAATAKARDEAAALWTILDRQLAGREHVCGALSLADIALGPFLHRWFALPVERPELPALAAWYGRLRQRPGFARHIDVPMQ